MTWARRLAQYGYRTVAAGKSSHAGDDKAQGWTRLIGHSGGCNVEIVEEAPDVRDADRPGEDRWRHRKEVQRAGVGKRRVGWKDRTDEYAMRGALNFVEEKYLSPYYDHERPERPVALKVNLSQPHYPFLTTEEKFEYYLNRVDPYDEGDAAFDDHPFLGNQRLEIGRDGFGVGREGDVSPREVRRATAAYYGMIETVDEYFGWVLDALEAAGQDLDEWLVVFTSDHGEMLGQHGVWEKGHFFEASARVPLVIRWPERFDPGVVEANVNLCDLFATLYDLTDVPLPEERTLDSRSLVPLLEGETGSWHEMHGDETVSAYGEDLMIKDGDLKYVHVDDGRDVLFDLDAHPREATNLIGNPDYSNAVTQFRARRDELGYGPDPDADYTDAGYAQCVSGERGTR